MQGGLRLGLDLSSGCVQSNFSFHRGDETMGSALNAMKSLVSNVDLCSRC